MRFSRSTLEEPESVVYDNVGGAEDRLDDITENVCRVSDDVGVPRSFPVGPTRKFSLQKANDDEDDDDDEPADSSALKSVKPSFLKGPKKDLKYSGPVTIKSGTQERVRLSADVDPVLRERVKIYCIRQSKPFFMILEDWIREHCPEP